MKKIISMTLLVPLLPIVLLLLGSCIVKNSDHDGVQETNEATGTNETFQKPKVQYTLASDIALKTLLASETPDVASIKMLYEINENANLDFIDEPLAFICCCPCTPPEGRECPCPPKTWPIMVHVNWKATEITLDGIPLQSSPHPTKKEWTIFHAKDSIFSDGEHNLNISASFFGKGNEEYNLLFQVTKGKAYLPKSK